MSKLGITMSYEELKAELEAPSQRNAALKKGGLLKHPLEGQRKGSRLGYGMGLTRAGAELRVRVICRRSAIWLGAGKTL
jgi:hypothetical protein